MEYIQIAASIIDRVQENWYCFLHVRTVLHLQVVKMCRLLLRKSGPNEYYKKLLRRHAVCAARIAGRCKEGDIEMDAQNTKELMDLFRQLDL